jgi:hypothetical protein
MKMPKESSVSSTMRGRCYIDWQRHVRAVIGCYALVQTALRRSFLPLDLMADVKHDRQQARIPRQLWVPFAFSQSC